MSLPFFIKHIYNNASEEVIRRGRRIFTVGQIDVLDHNPILESISFRMKDDMYNTWYKVKIERYNHPHAMNLQCNCPYNLTEVCRHKAAALLHLQEMNEKGMLSNQQVQYHQKHTLVKIRQIDLKAIRMLAGNENYEAAEELLRTTKANILHAANERVEAELMAEGKKYHLVIQKNDDRFFDTQCNCTETEHLICKHKTLLFLQLLNTHGAQYFESIRNYERDKERLLGMYGYKLSDDLSGKFEFVYKDGKPFLKLLDTTIKKINIAATTPAQKPASLPTATLEKSKSEPVEKRRLGIVFKDDTPNYPYLVIDLVQGMPAENGGLTGKVEKIDLGKFVDTEAFCEEDRQLLSLVRKISDSEVNKYLNRNSPFSGFWENIVQTNGTDLPPETTEIIHEYLHPKLKTLMQEYHSSPAFELEKGARFITSSLKPLTLSEEPIDISLLVEKSDKGFVLQAIARIQLRTIPLNSTPWFTPVLLMHEGEVFAWRTAEFLNLAAKYRQPLLIDAARWPEFAEKELLPLTHTVTVEFEPGITREITGLEPKPQLLLEEKGDFLTFIPQFYYGDVLAPQNEEATLISIQDGKITHVERMLAKERSFIEKIAALHTNFIRPQGSRQLALKGTDVLKQNWFFLFMEKAKEMHVTVVGFELLKNFRFNAARPATRIRVSSGVDWFDAEVDLSFGDQQVKVAEVKKALAQKQNVVQLSDGSLGILPEEWLKKYGLLFKMAEGKEKNLRLSRFQFSVIDELYEQRNDEEMVFEFDDKLSQLKEFQRIKKIAAPAHLQPILRPYQVSGFQWLNFLKESHCGGILADDMGLGKTVQALTMLEHFEKKEGHLRAMVVCPTTLLYNWENEIRKFTPDMAYFIHHGPQRSRSQSDIEQYHICITTYGTLRSDLLLLKEIEWDYIVLDESQAIKNPNSKIARAACLLTAHHKLCLSGTPLQNNTFDIYAQMNFLNPGLLGSADFFRNEFATPIDRFGEQDQKQHLRKLIYPFLLRRTKEQVAEDLPEKTETILYCEMGHEQRSVYNAYRNAYRNKVLGVIDEQGLGKSQLTILQGLMKLRQICDSPAILNEEEKFPNHSIKLEELVREITENISDHKALVFSQFLDMLGLIREKFEHHKISYEYFDGSTSIQERQRAIENFQNNSECRVFLISLKAGGVGLNLTAADYVYIVDPWWNPAVEQQAIDRTHRIGQTRNIFAYRMICRDTVEDKIIHLQEKKKMLAKELISDDANYVKRLTRDDIEYLFS